MKPRELRHDAQLYRVYKEEAARIEREGGHVTRILLDYELKRDYQQFLNRPDRRHDADVDADRFAFAAAHDLHVIQVTSSCPISVSGTKPNRDALSTATSNSRPSTTRAVSSPGRPRPALCATARLAPAVAAAMAAVAVAHRFRASGEALMTFIERVQALEPLGFSEVQTRFLVTVALHSGFCLRRHYTAFADLKYGQGVRDFLERLVARKLARRFAFRPDRGHVYHLHASSVLRGDRPGRQPQSTPHQPGVDCPQADAPRLRPHTAGRGLVRH